jgi:hypothetical protein
VSLAGLRNLAIVAGVAALVAFLPQGGKTADFVAQVLIVAFSIVFVLFAVRLYRMFRGDIYGLGERHRTMLYGSVGVAVLAMAALPRLFATGVGVLVWLVLMVGASAGLYAVWRHYRAYRI